MTTNNTKSAQEKIIIIRYLYILGAGSFLLIGTIGVVVPMLPTTPFVLLSVWLASKGSPTFENWIRNHPRYGLVIKNWKEEGSIPLKAKIVSFFLILTSALTIYIFINNIYVIALSYTILIFVIYFIMTRPTS